MKIKFFWFIGLSIFLADCANQLPPQGGEVDKTPPEIVAFYPANGTVNFKDNYVSLEFSEYVDKRSLQDAFFISPYVDGQIEFDWSGREVEIIFPDSLKPNTTYNITIGTEVKDIHNGNKMSTPLNFTFSTGAKIDSGKISGKVFGNKVNGVMVFAYKLANKKEVNPLKEKPDYISQVGENGHYTITGLADDSYRVFAIDDKFKDLLYNIGEDRYAAPYLDVKISSENSEFNNLNFKLTVEDTIKPYLLSAVMTDRNHIVVEFNEFIDSSVVSARNFFVYDSANAIKYPVSYFFKGKTKRYKYVVAVDTTIKKSDKLFLSALGIKDKAGNICEPQSIEFLYNTKPDTSFTDILKIKTDYEKNTVDYFRPSLFVELSDGVQRESVKNAFGITGENEKNVNFAFDFINDASFKILIKEKLNFRKKYLLKINMKLLKDIAGNSVDSVHTFSFNCMNKLDYSGVSGKFDVKIDSNSNVIAELYSAGGNNIIYKKHVVNSQFEFNNVYPDKYFLWYYIDPDSSGSFNYGKVFPFEPSERFNYYPDTLKLRPRWPVGDIILH